MESGSKGSPYTITIYGGDININANGAGAGIGGGYKCYASSFNGEGIRIYGGNIKAVSHSGAAIGNGYYEDGSYGSVAIYGGSVNARSTGGGAGIGGGLMGANGKIYIYGGDVTAEAENDDGQSGAGIGSGANRPLLNWENDRDINISGGSVSAISQTGAGIGAGYRRDGGNINITGGVVFACSTGGGAGIGGGFEKSGGVINIQKAIVLAYSTGNVDESLFQTVSSNMISAAQNAIRTFGSSLSGSGLDIISSAFSGLGSLFNANSGRGYGAGIGGSDKGNSGTINIKDSIIIAQGGDLGSGIGCGKQRKYENITIENSFVDSVGGNNGAGIGGGNEAGPEDNTKISIIGSTVKATGGSESAGIGSGNEYTNCGTIEIDSSTVEAHGGAYAAGIGGGEDEGLDTIIIRGESTVTGIGGGSGNALGIGHGAYSSFTSFFTGYYPSNGKLYFPETSLVMIGEDKDDKRVVPATYIYENGRGDEARYMSIYPCTHDSLEDYASKEYHGKECSYCHKAIKSENHIWGSDNKCTICGVSATMVSVTLKEQNNDSEVTRVLTVPQNTSFTMPEPENIPDGMGFVCWYNPSQLPLYAGDMINVTDNYTYTAVYAPVVETTYIDENGYQQNVTARKFPFTEKEAGPLYSGWYIIDENIPMGFGGVATVHGNVKLILADDVTVSSNYFGFRDPIKEQSSLTLYGQAKQTGAISPELLSDYGPITNFVQYGGRMTNVNLVTAGNIKIAGGVFDARSFEVSDKIELGWSRWSDSICVHDYCHNDTNPEISVIEGKMLKSSYDNYVLKSGVLSDNEKIRIQNSPLVPAVDFKFKTPPQWTWSEDHTEASASFSGGPEGSVTVTATVEKTLDGLYMDSTASVHFMGQDYTDTKHDQVLWNVNNKTNDTSVHGTVEISADTAQPGELVEITATPDKNFSIKSITVTPPLLSHINVEILGNGEAFIMPQCDVTVEVVFEQQDPCPITILKTGKGTVTANVDEEFGGKEITLNIAPEEDHLLSDISVTYADAADSENVNLTVLSGDGEGDEGYVKLLDGNTATKWCIGVTEPRHIIMKANSKVCMTEYSLTTGNDNASWKGRNWKDYTIYGANFASDSEAVRDSAQWQVVKAVENDSVTQDVNLTRYDYPLDTPAAPYQYYKIEIMSNKDGSSIQMSEFGMKAVAPQEITLSGEGNTRTFTMPVYPVTVNAVFLPYLAGYSLSLNGDIGVNYFLNLTDRDITDGAKLAFAWTVNGKEKTHSVTLSSADKTSNGYKASCPIAVTEMTHEITATLTIGETVVATYTYSAVTYADEIVNGKTFRTNYIAENGEKNTISLLLSLRQCSTTAQRRRRSSTRIRITSPMPD